MWAGQQDKNKLDDIVKKKKKRSNVMKEYHWYLIFFKIISIFISIYCVYFQDCCCFNFVI